MAECYNCGTYIPRGQGYRRQMQTGTRSSSYYGSRNGGSFSSMHGTRTVCSSCALVMDKQNEGGFVRFILYFIAWAISAYIGFAIAKEHIIVGLFLLIGGPVWIAGYFIEKKRSEEIRENVYGSQGNNSNQEYSSVSYTQNIETSVSDIGNIQIQTTLRQGEQISDWILRIAPLVTTQGASESDTMSKYLKMTKYTLPKVGETLDKWFGRVELEMKRLEQMNEQDIANTMQRVVLRQGESIVDWVTRILDGVPSDDAESERNQFIAIAERIPPKVGEDLRQWIDRIKNVQ